MCHSSCARLLTSTSTTRTAGSCRCAPSQAASTSTSSWVFIMGSSTIEFGHRGARCGVDAQPEDVRPVVVTNRIHVAASCRDGPQVEVCDQGGGEPHVDTLGVQVEPGQRHVVLTADQAADPGPAGVHH